MTLPGELPVVLRASKVFRTERTQTLFGVVVAQTF